jgi:hypothetical protein
MTMIPSVSPEKFPPNLFVPCEACVAPVDATAPSYADCTYLATNKLCVDSVTIGNIDFAASGGNTACGTASFTDASLASQTHDASGCCFSLKDAPYDTYAGYYKQFNCPPSATMFIGFAICINATTGAISVTITVTQQFALVTNYIFTATYTAVGPVTVGANTVTYVSSSGVATGGGGAITDASWPGTLTINASHCLFGDTHYDYGYGCGNGSGSCVGKCQVRSTAGASPTGFVWTFTGAVASTCVGAGCGCPTIDAITAIWGYPEANDPVEYVNVDCVSS